MTTPRINILTLLPCNSTSAPQTPENAVIHSTQNSLPLAVANVAAPMIHPMLPQMPLTYCLVIPVTFQVPPQAPLPPHPIIARSPGAHNIAGSFLADSFMANFFDNDQERALFMSYHHSRGKVKEARELLQKKIQQNPAKYDILLTKLLTLFPRNRYPISVIDLLIELQPSNPRPIFLKGAALIKEHSYREGITQIKEGFLKNPIYETIELLLPLMAKLQPQTFQLQPELMATIPECDQALLRGIFLSANANFDRANRCLEEACSDISTSPLARTLQSRNQWVNKSSQPVLPSRSAEEAVDLLNGFAQGLHETATSG